ncbi:MAG: response regulator transcription factor [Bacteroidetes bacterium]|nr:response regulator transcription factor [Bacteroidota bacterium]
MNMEQCKPTNVALGNAPTLLLNGIADRNFSGYSISPEANNGKEIIQEPINEAGILEDVDDRLPATPAELRKRELQFLELVCTELTYREIAQKMFLSPRTIDGYRDDLFDKLRVKTRVGLVIYAIRNGIFKVSSEL